VRERIKGTPDTATAPYCSPVLVETLFWEGLDHLPNAHRKTMELDFPDRVDALLDFHCIAFHADINVLKELYDEDVLGNRGKKKEILDRHRTKMEAVMATFAADMKSRWEEETERLRSRSARSSGADCQTPSDWMIGVSPPTGSRGGAGGVPVTKRAHMADPPTILGSAERQPKKANTLPLRGILKNRSASSSMAANDGSASSSRYSEPEFESPIVETGADEDDFLGSFVLGELISGTEEDLDIGEPYLGPEIVLASQSYPRYTQTAEFQQPVYETWRPSDDELSAATPRAVSNVARLTQRFEEGTGKGKGKARFVNLN